MILAELLPLPLPIPSPQVRQGDGSDRDKLELHSSLPPSLPPPLSQSPSEVDVNSALCLRRLWAGHLQPFHGELEDVLKALLGSSCPAVQAALRRVVAQLSDLSPVLSPLVAHHVLLATMTEIEREEAPHEEEGTHTDSKKRWAWSVGVASL